MSVAEAAPLHAALDLEKVVNFRDFGGHVGADGRRVARGRLYRSGHFGRATPEDMARIGELGVSMVVDLRRIAEREREPSPWPQPFAGRVLEHGGPHDPVVAPHLAYLTQDGLTPDDVAERLSGSYRRHPFDAHYAALFRSYFDALSDIEGAVLIHCHAGKDRTGMLAALTLHALGVAYDDIVDDFLATNLYSRVEKNLRARLRDFERDNGRPVDEALMWRMLGVERGYIDAMCAEMVQRHGSVDAYLEEAMGVTPAVRERLRDRFLER